MLASAACSGDGEDAVPIGGTVRAITPSQFEVIVGCFDSVRVEVDQDADRVVLRGFGTGQRGGDCGNFDVVALDDPLDDRSLIDGKSGRTIPVITTPG